MAFNASNFCLANHAEDPENEKNLLRDAVAVVWDEHDCVGLTFRWLVYGYHTKYSMAEYRPSDHFIGLTFRLGQNLLHSHYLCSMRRHQEVRLDAAVLGFLLRDGLIDHILGHNKSKSFISQQTPQIVSLIHVKNTQHPTSHRSSWNSSSLVSQPLVLQKMEGRHGLCVLHETH